MKHTTSRQKHHGKGKGNPPRPTGKRQLFSLVLAVSLVLAMGLYLPGPVTAEAAGMESGFDGVSAGEIVYFAGHQWGIIDGNGTLLHVSGDVGGTVHTTDEYYGSHVQKRMEEIAGRIDPRESSAIIPRTLTAGSDAIYGLPVVDQKLWALSNSEVSAVRASVNSLIVYSKGAWWTRTRWVVQGGFVHSVLDDGIDVLSSLGNLFYARPALYLDTSKVLFTSDAAGGKPGGMSLTQAPAPASGEYKLTVLDPGLNQLSLALDEASNGSGSLNFAFDRAAAGANRYVSCVLERGGVEYYGKLASTGTGSGTFTIDTTGVAAGDYTLRLFVEEDNGDYKTDFAAVPIDMALTVDAVGNGKVTGYDTNAYRVSPTVLDIATGDTGSFTVDLGGPGSRADQADVASANPAVATASPTQLTQGPATVTVTGRAAGSTTVNVTFSGGDIASPTQIPVTVNVADILYTITATAGDGGSVTPSGSLQVVKGGSRTFTIQPDQGHHIADVVVDGISQGAVSSYTFQDVGQDHTISASFQRDPDPAPHPGPPPHPTVSSGGSASDRSDGSGTTAATTTAKSEIPSSAFSWDGQTLTIDYPGITPLGLQTVRWDGVETTDYRAFAGSVIIRFDRDFIGAQAPGEHTVRVAFLGHTGTATVTVAGGSAPIGEAGETQLSDYDSYNPNTGGDPAHWDAVSRDVDPALPRCLLYGVGAFVAVLACLAIRFAARTMPAGRK